jgi:DNA-binding NarL/FixJ family response regulator
VISPLLASVGASEGTQAVKTVRILVADDHDVVCAGLQRMIASQPGMEVCGMAGSGIEAVEKADTLRPDVAILDMNMSGLNGLECTRQIRKALPECEVLLFTGIETDALMREAFAAGAKSFILKSDARDHLLGAIRSLAARKAYFTNKVSEVIFARLFTRKSGPADAAPSAGRLNTHELEIVRQLASGDSNRDLAEWLGVNLRTAEGQRAAVMRKMKFDSLADLVRYAVRNGIVQA